jgi:hypothetical protein
MSVAAEAEQIGRLAVLSLASSSTHRKRLAVFDGRKACGSIEQSSSGFIATDACGRLIGAFPTLIDAARSLPAVGASS